MDHRGIVADCGIVGGVPQYLENDQGSVAILST